MPRTFATIRLAFDRHWRVAIVRTLLWVVAGVLVSSARLFAQTAEPAMPYRGLFGGSSASAAGPKTTVAVDSVAVNIQTFGLWEEDVEPSAMPDGSGSKRTIRAYSAVLAELARAHNGRRLSYAVRASSQFRAPAMIGGTNVDNQSVTVGIRDQVSPRTALTASQQVTYAPVFILDTSGANPTALVNAVGTRSVQGVTTMTNLTSSTGVSLAHELSRRTSANVAYGFTWVDFTKKGATVTTNQAQASLGHALRRDMTVQLRYTSMWSANAAPEASSTVHAQDAGVALDYSPALSRRTRLTVSAFPTFKSESSTGTDAGGALTASSRSWFGMGGSVALDHDLSRVWRSGARYERTWYYLPGSTQAIQADSLGGQLAGSYRDRFTAALAGSFSHGKPDLKGGSQSHVNTVSVAARVEFMPTRHMGVFGEFRRDTLLTAGAVTTLNGLSGTTTRSSVRGGAKFDLPPYGR